MRTFQIFMMTIVLGLLTTSMTGYAQTAELTVVIKGIKEAKGKVLIAVGDRANPQGMITEMIEVTGTKDIVCILQNIPVGKQNLYIFQDMNGDYQLNTDESQIPIEPCFSKEKLVIKEGTNKTEAKLMNIKEMMGL